MNDKSRTMKMLSRVRRGLLLLCICTLCACGVDDIPLPGELSGNTAGSKALPDQTPLDQHRETKNEFALPQAPGTLSESAEDVILDYSNTSAGYIMVRHNGASEFIRIHIIAPDETIYQYILNGTNYRAFPFTKGNGTYQIQILRPVGGDQYAVIFTKQIDVAITDEFTPFLYPNNYSWYTPESETVKLGTTLSNASEDDLSYVKNVYHYVINTVTYDTAKAENTPLNYIPDVDATLRDKTGICFDYAALMTALLRSQGIPTRLVVGYSGTVYHAWLNVYLSEYGWIDNIISFDGKDWTLMDPTLASGNSAKDLAKYIGDGTNYTVKYWY